MERRAVRYEVKNVHGQLTFGSLRELRTLYQREFLSDDDLVRREGTDRWIPAGLMPELKGSRELVVDHSSRVWGVVGLVALVACVVGMLKVGAGMAALIVFGLCAFAVAAAVAFMVARRRRNAALATRQGGEATSPPPANGTLHGQSQGQGN